MDGELRRAINISKRLVVREVLSHSHECPKPGHENVFSGGYRAAEAKAAVITNSSGEGVAIFFSKYLIPFSDPKSLAG